MSDLEKALVRSAPRALVGPELPSSSGVTVEVIEPEDELQVGPVASASVPEIEVRIPRRAPQPNPKPRAHRLSKKKAAVLADRVAKREAKKNRRVPPRHKRFCKLCTVSCNSAKSYYDHTHSRGHLTRVQNARRTPRCVECNRTFESHGHLERHRNGLAHLKVATRKSLE